MVVTDKQEEFFDFPSFKMIETNSLRKKITVQRKTPEELLYWTTVRVNPLPSPRISRKTGLYVIGGNRTIYENRPGQFADDNLRPSSGGKRFHKDKPWKRVHCVPQAQAVMKRDLAFVLADPSASGNCLHITHFVSVYPGHHFQIGQRGSIHIASNLQNSIFNIGNHFNPPPV